MGEINISMEETKKALDDTTVKLAQHTAHENIHALIQAHIHSLLSLLLILFNRCMQQGNVH